MNDLLLTYCLLLMLPGAVYSLVMAVFTWNSFYLCKLTVWTLTVKSLVLLHEKEVAPDTLRTIVAILVLIAVLETCVTIIFDTANVIKFINFIVFLLINNFHFIVIAGTCVYLIVLGSAITGQLAAIKN